MSFDHNHELSNLHSYLSESQPGMLLYILITANHSNELSDMPVSEMIVCLLPTTRDQQIIISLHNSNGQYYNRIIIFIFHLSSKFFSLLS